MDGRRMASGSPPASNTTHPLFVRYCFSMLLGWDLLGFWLWHPYSLSYSRPYSFISLFFFFRIIISVVFPFCSLYFSKTISFLCASKFHSLLLVKTRSPT
ncbi:hypothetical protein BDN70DRAFT_371663 [Pholiota conissans]|uniref:Uncharacterized protein n=1 Tax=Pholiota conissans TaxID=109636 RepID=A0A9P6D098_9AGAR|nr:hypothetical protein BDN70DRAFT_371663 [Pholiota conissans]